MRRFANFLSWALFATALCTAPFCTAQVNAPKYTVTDLGVLPGFQVSQATALSNNGVVAGFSASSAFPLFTSLLNNAHSAHGWINVNGVFTDLGNPNTAQLVVPIAVSDNNLLTVLAGTDIGSSAYLYQNGVFSQPSKFPGGSLPPGVNDSGEVSGTRFVSSKPTAFTFVGGVEQDLPTGQGANNNLAFGISSNGIVAGALAGASNNMFPVTWATGEAPVLYTLPQAFSEGVALAVNSSGNGAGFLFNGGLNTEAAIFGKGVATAIGGYPGAMASVATGINESGTVVGFSIPAGLDTSKIFSSPFDPTALLPPSTDSRAFVYTNGILYDLTAGFNDVTWTFNYAAAINDSGQIAGTGFHNGKQTAFLLTPKGGANTPVVGAVVSAGLSKPSVTTLAPGSLIAIFGTSLSTVTTPAGLNSGNVINGVLPTTLGGTCVEVNGVPAPLTYVSATQVNAEIPELASTGLVGVVVTANCGTASPLASIPYSVNIAPQAPEFLYWNLDPSGLDQVIAVEYPSGDYAASVNLIPGLTTTPAKSGDVLVLYALGLGATIPPVTPGELAPGIASLAGRVTVTIGGVAASILYAGVAPGYSGLYQINLTVPNGLPVPQGLVGLLPIFVTVAGSTSPTTAIIAISN